MRLYKKLEISEVWEKLCYCLLKRELPCCRGVIAENTKQSLGAENNPVLTASKESCNLSLTTKKNWILSTTTVNLGETLSLRRSKQWPTPWVQPGGTWADSPVMPCPDFWWTELWINRWAFLEAAEFVVIHYAPIENQYIVYVIELFLLIGECELSTTA